jgi:hypothetical protein
MNTYLMKKAMIEAAIDRGIQEMADDPERSVRRLTDLGKHFSKNRFQDTIFSAMQKLLDNEHSAYYDMVHNLLENSDSEMVKKFGVNFGYMSWTYGASEIRTHQKADGVSIPWAMMLRYDSTAENGLSEERLARMMEQGQDLGIYAWFLRECGDDLDSYHLLTLLERYKECACVWFKNSGRLTAAQIQMLKMCKNTVVSLPLDDPETLLTASLLRDQKIPFALYVQYGAELSRESAASCMEKVLSSETAMLFLIAEDGIDPTAGLKIAYQSRLDQKYPCVIMDYYGDAESISNVICEHPYLLEIGADGCMIRPDGRKGCAFPFDLPLKEALAQVMPAFPGNN